MTTEKSSDDFSHQFGVLFEKIDSLTNYIQKLEKQNTALYKKVANIEHFIKGKMHKEILPNQIKTEKKKYNHSNKEQKDNTLDQDMKKKEEIIKKEEEMKKKDEIENDEIENKDDDDGEKRVEINNENVIDDDDDDDDDNDNDKESDEISAKDSITPKLPKEPKCENQPPRRVLTGDDKKINDSNLQNDNSPRIKKKVTMPKKKIQKTQKNLSFKIGYMGEGYVFEALNRFGCFSEIIWNAKTENKNNPSIILNNNHQYYIHGDGEHYDILATDKGGKQYYIEVKSTSSMDRNNLINRAQAEFCLQLSFNVRHFILAKVMNVLKDPIIEFYNFDPSSGYELIDIQNEITDEYFLKSLFGNKKTQKQISKDIIKPEIKNQKKK